MSQNQRAFFYISTVKKYKNNLEKAFLLLYNGYVEYSFELLDTAQTL